MDKVAYFKGVEVARETAIQPFLFDDKFPNSKKYNRVEGMEFFHRIAREHKISYNNSDEVEYIVSFQESPLN